MDVLLPVLAVLGSIAIGTVIGAGRERARVRSGAPAPTRRRRVLVTMLVLGITGLVAGMGSYAAFNSTTSNTGDTFEAGTVQITDNHNPTALISLANAKPGDTDSGCIQVSYSGTLSAAVKLYGSGTGTLAPYLNLTVTRGTDSNPSYRSCNNFNADGTDYIGHGNGVIYDGTLSAFPSSYASGISDPAVGGGTETWTNPESHSYKFTITAQDVNASQGLTGSASFTWEARNT
jgi:predicted ribosomally synthesized peptide with SipW-like signal peptide